MQISDILYIVIIVATVVITVTLVWLANETIGLIRSLRKSADDAAVVTKEFKEKTLLVTEAMDRVGTVATSVIGMVEDAIETIKEKRDKLADGLALVTSMSKYVKRNRQDGEADDSEKGKVTSLRQGYGRQESEKEKTEESEKKEKEEKTEKTAEKKSEKKDEEPKEKQGTRKDDASEVKEVKGV